MSATNAQDDAPKTSPQGAEGGQRTEAELLALAEEILEANAPIVAPDGDPERHETVAMSAVEGPLFEELLRDRGLGEQHAAALRAKGNGGRVERAKLTVRCAEVGLELGDQAGEGGMGVVYRARDQVLDRAVAIKTVYVGRSVHGESWEAVRERFRREARTLSQLDHPNICQVHRLIEGDDTSFGAGRNERSQASSGDPDLLVLEWVEGRTLAEASLASLPLHESLVALEQIAEALSSAHRRGIVHRDLKPANVMRRPSGQIKVLDFGIARSVGEEMAGPASLGSAGPAAPRQPPAKQRADLTQGGVVLGTPGYVSPEQLRGELVGPPSDVWSFGVLAQQQVGYGAVWSDDRDVLDQIAEGSSLPARGGSRPLCELIDSCRAASSEDRPSAAQIAERLRRIRTGPARRRRRLQLAMAAVVAAVSLLAAVVLPALERRRSAQRVRQVQQISRELSAIEADLERETLLPEHSLEAARTVARRRLEAAQRDLDRGLVDETLGAYAAGRGALALGDLRKARPLLERAWQDGLREAAVPLGRTLALLYEQALEDAESIADAGVRAAAEERARLQLQEPAVRLLEDAIDQEASTETAGPVARAELLLLRGEIDGALALLDSVAAMPVAIQPVARLVRAHAWRRQASILVASGGRERAAESVRRARRDLEEALTIARSSPALSLELCRLEGWNLGLLRDLLGSSTVEPERVQPAVEACRRAVRIDPEKFEAVRLLADAHRLGAWEAPTRLSDWAAAQMASSRELLMEARTRFAGDPRVDLAWLQHLSRESEAMLERGDDIVPLLEEAEELAAGVVEALPGNAEAPLSIGLISWNRAFRLFAQGADARAEFERSIGWLQRAVDLAPDASNVVNLLGAGQGMLGLSRMQRGEDPRPMLRRCIATFERAIELYPENPYPRGNLGMAYRDLADHAVWTGEDPDALVVQGVEVLEAARALTPSFVDTWLTQSELELALARSRSGPAALQAYRRAERSARAGLEIDPRAGLRLRLAESLLGQYRVGVEERRADDGLRREIETAVDDMRRSGTESFRVLRFEAAFQLLRAAQGSSATRSEWLSQAERAARAAVAGAPTDAQNHLQLAKVLVAQWRHRGAEGGDVTESPRRLDMVRSALDDAVRLNAHLLRQVDEIREELRGER